jgi:hypothetical protein
VSVRKDHLICDDLVAAGFSLRPKPEMGGAPIKGAATSALVFEGNAREPARIHRWQNTPGADGKSPVQNGRRKMYFLLPSRAWLT